MPIEEYQNEIQGLGILNMTYQLDYLLISIWNHLQTPFPLCRQIRDHSLLLSLSPLQTYHNDK